MVLVIALGEPGEHGVEPVDAGLFAGRTETEPALVRRSRRVQQNAVGVLREQCGVGRHERTAVRDAVEVQPVLAECLAGLLEVAGGVVGGDGGRVSGISGLAGRQNVARRAEQRLRCRAVQRGSPGQTAGFHRQQVVVLPDIGGHGDASFGFRGAGVRGGEHAQCVPAGATGIAGDGALALPGGRDAAHGQGDRGPVRIGVVAGDLDLGTLRRSLGT